MFTRTRIAWIITLCAVTISILVVLMGLALSSSDGDGPTSPLIVYGTPTAEHAPVAVEAEAVAEGQPVGGAPADALVADTNSEPGSNPNPKISQSERMVIKNGDLSLMVESTDAALNRISNIATQYGGYVISSAIDNNGPFDTATITIAVESAHFETAMNDIRTAGMKVLHDSASGQDVTGEYVDLEARLRSLEATRDRIQAFLDEAENVDEALAVNDKLTQIESEIEQVKGRMQYLSGRAAFSTITIALREPDPPTKPTPTPSPTPKPPGWSVRSTFDTALGAQESFIQTLIEGVVWLAGVTGPYVLVGGLILLRWRRRQASRS